MVLAASQASKAADMIIGKASQESNEDSSAQVAA